MKKLINSVQKPKAKYSCPVKNEVSMESLLANQGVFKLDFPTVFLEDTTYSKEFQCSRCGDYLTEQDISQNNYNLWVVNEISEITKTDNIHGFGDGKPAYEISFRLWAVEHQTCLPESN